MNSNQNGKGDTPRPLSVDHKTFADNWDRVFSQPEETCAYSGLPTTSSYINLGDYSASKRN